MNASPSFINTAHGIRATGLARVAGPHISLAPNDAAPKRPLPDQRLLWMAVGAAFQDGRDECRDCGFKSGYEGAPGESLSECTLGRRSWHRPQHCAAVCQDLQADADAALTGGVA